MGGCTNIYQQSDDEKRKQFWTKILKRIEHNRNGEQIRKIQKELKGLEEEA